MDYSSPFALAKAVSSHIGRLLAELDIDALSLAEREAVMLLKNQSIDLRIDLRDYGVAESRSAQERIAKEMTVRIDRLQATILQVSEYNLIGAADVAQLSANVQQLAAVL